MARSRTSGRRSTGRAPAAAPDGPAGVVETVAAPTLATATLPRVWQNVGYRPLADPTTARSLFDFAAVAWPPSAVARAAARATGEPNLRVELEPCWGAYVRDAAGEQLVGAGIGEHAGSDAMLHGPVIAARDDALEVATQMVAAWLDHATALGVQTVFARPLGLDRIWIRFGFIPVPEGALPRSLSGRPGAGLFAWRGGSALWSFRELRD